MSYWISVTFFEGSVFFTISSFLGCYPEYLGNLKKIVTTWGYLAGHINFMVCTYLMCVATINLSNADLGNMQKAKKASLKDCSSSDDDEESSGNSDDSDDGERWHWWPFRVRMAIDKLDALGAGPWPYFAGAIYLVGVLVMGVGYDQEKLQSHFHWHVSRSSPTSHPGVF